MTKLDFDKLDHPCKQTCSGWAQGKEKGIKEVIEFLTSSPGGTDFCKYVDCTPQRWAIEIEQKFLKRE